MTWLRRYPFREPVILFLFALLGLIIYWNSLGNAFQYDDQIYVTFNTNIRTLKNVPDFFTNLRTLASAPHLAGHYRPLVVVSYALNFAAGELNPAGYHLVNLAFHVGTAFLVYLVVKAMAGGRVNREDDDLSWAGSFAAVAAGLIFLVHPFNSEIVNYITARSSVMSGFFYLAGFYCWVRFRDAAKLGSRLIGFPATWFYIASILSFILGMLSKEVAITMPVAFWLYDLYFHRPSPAPGVRTQFRAAFLNWRTYLSYLPFFLAVIIPYLFIRATSFGSALPRFQRDIWSQIATELPVIVKHWQMFFVPYPLSPVHFVEINNSFLVFPVISSAVILIVYTSLAVILSLALSQLWRVISFFMFWFFIVLLPTTIIPLNTIFQENRGYLAAVSFVVIAGMAVERLRNRLKVAGIIALILIIAICSAGVVRRNRVWKNELTLWTDTVQKEPRTSLGYTALGVAYRRAGMYNEALDSSRKALILGGDNNLVAHENLGRVYMARERWDLAEKEFEKVVKIDPLASLGHTDLGVTYYKLGKFELAEKQYREAIRLDHFDFKPYFNIGVLYMRQGKRDEAIYAFRKSLSLFPDHPVSHLNLGIMLEEKGIKGEAAEHYRIVLRQTQPGGEQENEIVEEAGRRLAGLNNVRR